MSNQSELNFPADGEHDSVEISDEQIRWHARDACFMAGKWSALAKRIPNFEIEDFKATPDGPVNPYLRSVVRLPLTSIEQRVPVGVVSNTYSLAQHIDVIEKCFDGLRTQKIDIASLNCEVGLTPLGEWMNFRAYFPDEYSFTPADGKKIALRLECFNSVDGSSRLVILLGWLRFVCSNGMIIGETKAELKDTHDKHLNLKEIPQIISNGLAKVHVDLRRLKRWELVPIEYSKFENWVDGDLAKEWGKKAACRVLYICRTGSDVELADPFEGGRPTEKAVNILNDVPGAPKPSKNLYDVCQALAWVATHKKNADERMDWQMQIPSIIEKFERHLKRA